MSILGGGSIFTFSNFSCVDFDLIIVYLLNIEFEFKLYGEGNLLKKYEGSLLLLSVKHSLIFYNFFL